MAELKPCPFCGGEPFVDYYDYEKYGKTYVICCNGCHAETFERDTPEEAAEAWNRRVDNGNT